MRLTRRSAAWLVWSRALALAGPLMKIASRGVAVAAVRTAAQASVVGQWVWAYVTNPGAHEGRDATVHDEAVRLVTAAPAGSTIEGMFHSFTVQPVAESLVAAERRGVDVSLLMDGDNEGSLSPAVALTQQLNSGRSCTCGPVVHDPPDLNQGSGSLVRPVVTTRLLLAA